MPSRRSWRFLPAFITALAIGSHAGATMPGPETPEENDRPAFAPHTLPGFAPSEHGLATTALVVESLGLAMYRPKDSVVSIERAGGQTVASIFDGGDVPGWSLTVQFMVVEPGSTPQQYIKQHLEALTAAGRDFRLIEDRDVTAGNADGRLCYIQQNVSGEMPLINGWLILPVAGDLFLVFSILAVPAELPTVRGPVEAAFSTINLRSAAELSLGRRSVIEAGRRFLESIDEGKLRSLLGTQQWSRIYAVERDGTEREIGYSLLEVYEARRGELDPDRSERQYTVADRVNGIMVRLQGRIIGDLQRNILFDSVALYWMAWDQSEEGWSVRGVQRQNQAQRSEAETGFRLAPSVSNPRPTLRVARLRSGDYENTPAEWPLPDVYLSQALGALLGRLLPQDNDRPLELAYYFYNYSQAMPQLTKRLDRWAPLDDDSGRWRLSTRLSEDLPPILSTYAPDGTWLRTERPDGALTVPTTLHDLRQLWRRKGLPMGDS